MKNLLLEEEIKKVLSMMGLPYKSSQIIKEAIGTGGPFVKEFAEKIKGILMKTGKSLSVEEKNILSDFVDQANKYEKDFASDFRTIADDLTTTQLKRLENFISTKSDMTLRRTIIDASIENSIFLKKIEFQTNEEYLTDALDNIISLGTSRTKYPDLISDLNYLHYNYKTAPTSDLFDKLNKLRALSGYLPDDLKKIFDDFIDELDTHVERRAENELNGVMSDLSAKQADELFSTAEANSLRDYADEILDDVETDGFDFSRNRSTREVLENDLDFDAMTAREVENKLKSTFMEKLKKVCNTGFCSTMQGYYNSKSKKFDVMWDLILKELETSFKTTTKIEGSVSEQELTKHKLILKFMYSKKVPLTKSEYIKIGEAVYEGWKGGGFMEKVSLPGLFGTKEQAFYTISRLFLGQDVFTGKFIGWVDVMKKWAVFNTIILAWDLGNGFWQLKFGSDNPNQTEEDIIKNGIADFTKNALSLVGGPPIWRLGLTIVDASLQKFLPDAMYVNEEDLVDYIKKDSKTTYNPGYTEMEIYDNIIANTGVTISYEMDDNPPYTKISGISDVKFNYYNGRYSWDRTGNYSWQINFIREGEKIAKKEVKSEEISKEIIETLEDQIATNSVLSEFIKDRLTGLIKKHKKHIDFKKQEIMVDGNNKKIICIIFEYEDTEGVKNMFAFNYSEYSSSSNKDLKDVDFWNNIVKEYKG